MAATIINQQKPVDAAPSPVQAPRQIRFVNNQGHPPSKRRRINAACLTCRKRKTRCAGERPLCSTCTKNGHQCLGYPEDKKDSNDGGEARAEGDEDDHQEDEPVEKEHKHTLDEERTSKKPRTAPTASSTPSTTHTAPESKPIPSPKKLSRPGPSVTQRHVTPTSAHFVQGDASSPPMPPARATVSPQIARALTVDSMTSHPDGLDSPGMLRRNVPAENHRVPYFRYFGPTAIVPGFKQMVVSVKDRRRSTNGSHSGASPLSNPSGIVGSNAAESEVIVEDAPAYDPTDAAPVHPLIISLAKTFFVHLGCNYPFLKQRKFMNMVKEKRAEPILVDAVCALAARFSDSPILTAGNDKMPRTERGHIFAQRAKAATVETFACPTVPAVQACLMMAYEGFGANQDSALWMYLGLAIRMAVDMGLQKQIGIQYQGENDPYNTQQVYRNPESASPEEVKSQQDGPSQSEQRELEQERIDTFWALFLLDRVISSGTGRPVTIRDDDFELSFPKLVHQPDVHWPSPFPVLIEIVHLYGRVSDVLNNVHDTTDLTQEKWQKLTSMERQLTKVYKNWDARMQFNVVNFKAYLSVGQGTNFILLHFWFHALFIVLHQPTLLTPFGELRTELQLLPDSRELSMSSAKTICDILSFADLIDPKSFIGNPFTSQPMYIAACAFLMESTATASEGPSPEPTPPPQQKQKASGSTAKETTSKKSRHSLLASAANQNYQRCYQSLENLQMYWGGVKYILTALDQKAKGIWDCETYTTEEYESTKMRQNSIGSQFQFENQTSPKMGGPPIGWTLAGTANSPNSSLTLMYQNPSGPMAHGHQPPGMGRPGSTPPGSALDDGTRHMREPGGMYPPPFPQAQTSAVRASPRMSSIQQGGVRPQPIMMEGLSEDKEGVFMPSNTTNFTPTSQHSSGFDGYSNSPTSNMADSARGMYYPQNMAYPSSWGAGAGNMDSITFDSQDIDISSLGLQQPELMSGGWFEYIPNDVLGLFDHNEMNQGGPSGQGGHGGQ